MRARNIKPGFFDNVELGELSVFARLLFIGLWCFADKRGKFKWEEKRIKARIFPYNPEVEINKELISLVDSGFLLKYSVSETTYGLIPNFEIHQRPHPNEKESIFPNPGDKEPPQEEFISWPKLRETIFKRDGRICAFCDSTEMLVVDHIVPTAHGGRNEISNLQVLCRACNKRKAKWDEDGLTLSEMKKQTKVRKSTHQGTKTNVPGHDPLRTDIRNPDIRKEDNRKRSASPPVVLPPWLPPKTWDDFLGHRKKLKAPMSDVAQTRAIQKLTVLRDDGNDVEEVINESIVNGWKGLFAIKTAESEDERAKRRFLARA